MASFPVTFLKCTGCSWTRWCGIAAAGGSLPGQDHRSTDPIHHLCIHSRWAVRCYPITEFSFTSQRKIQKKCKTFQGNNERTYDFSVCIKLKVTYIIKLAENFDKFDILNYIFDIFMILDLMLKKGIPFIHSNYSLGYSTHDFYAGAMCFLLLLVFADGIFFFSPISIAILKYFNMKCIIPKYTTYIHIVLKYTYIVL